MIKGSVSPPQAFLLYMPLHCCRFDSLFDYDHLAVGRCVREYEARTHDLNFISKRTGCKKEDEEPRRTPWVHEHH